jgi:putative phosphoribosyl transferase
MSPLFADRSEAGRALARQLFALNLRLPVVLALPRGGVPVAAEVARELRAPLDLLLVRKIGVPWQPELAVAAIVDGDHPELVIDEQVQQEAGVDPAYISSEAQRQLVELERRRRVYLAGRLPVPLHGRTAIVVDDGIATGTSVRAALTALRRRRPAKVVLAVPVAPHETIKSLRVLVDRIVCLHQPEPFYAIGMLYGDFHQVADEEVIAAFSDPGGLSSALRLPPSIVR